MNSKSLLVKFIEKYYLNGQCPSAVIIAEDGGLSTKFVNEGGNLRGHVVLTEGEFPEGIIGAYSTKKLLQFLGVLDENILVEYKGENSDGSVISVHISDNNSATKAKFGTATNITIINGGGDVQMPAINEFDITIELDEASINGILKCFNGVGIAVSAQSFTLQRRGDSLFCIYGYAGSDNDEIEVEWNVEIGDDFEDGDMLSFPADVIKEILSINKSFSEATMKISSNGYMKLNFKDSNTESTYWVAQNAK